MAEQNDLLEDNADNADLYDATDSDDATDGDSGRRLVKRAIITYEEGQSDQEDELVDWEQIKDDYDNAFSTEGLVGMKFMYSKETFNVIKKLIEKLDLLNFNVKVVSKGDADIVDKLIKEARKEGVQNVGEGVKKLRADMENTRRVKGAIIKAGVEYIMREGGWVNALKADKDGAYFMMTLLGDSFVFVEANGKANKENPVPMTFKVLSPDRVFFNRRALKMRNSAKGNNVRRAFLIYDMSFDEYMSDIVPDIKDTKMRERAENIVWGDLPSLDDLDRLDRLDEIRGDSDESIISRRGQVGVYIDLDAKAKIVIAGGQATIIGEFLDDDFPYIMKDKPYMPIIQFCCFGKSRGFYNAGEGQYMSEITQLDELLQNKTVSGAIKEVDPFDILTVADGKASQVQARINDAEISAAEGRRAIVINEVGDQGEMIKGMQKLSGGGIGASGDAIALIRDRLKIEMGMDMRDVSTDKEKTAFAIERETAAQEALPKGIMARNAEEYKMAIEVIVDLMPKLISKGNKTIIPVSELKMSDDPDSITITETTLGEVIALMKEEGTTIQITIEDQTGVIPSDFDRTLRIRSMLPFLEGTAAGAKLIRELSRLSGFNFSDDELTIAPPPEGAEVEGEQGGEQVAQAGQQVGAAPLPQEQLRKFQQPV